VLRIMGADQIEYECVLPAAEVAPAPKSVEEEASRSRRSKKRQKQWLEALAPLSKKALVHRAGWWTYEFRYQKQMKQYHDLTAEEQASYPGAPLRDEYLLGRFVPEKSKSKVDMLGTKLVQDYLDGDVCFLPGAVTGPSRKTEVHFKCDSSAQLDYISEVMEISTCNYLVTVGTPRVCVLAEENKPKNGDVKCYPTRTLEPSQIFHQAHSDSEHTTALSDEDRRIHRKNQHNLIRGVASKNKFPQFSRLVNELLTEMGDLFEDIDSNLGITVVPIDKPDNGTTEGHSESDSSSSESDSTNEEDLLTRLAREL